MDGCAWAFEHSVECPATREFAWRFWTTVSNWKLDTDVDSVELNGPFASGSHGATLTRSSGRIEWRLASVQAETEAVIEISLPGAVGRFHWRFEDAGGATRITQRVSLEGEPDPSLVKAAASAFEAGIPAGMEKLCQAIAKAAAES